MTRLILVRCGTITRVAGNGCLATLRCLLWPRRRPHRAARICVYRIGAIGDLVCATPVLFAIHRAYPDAHLTLLTTPGTYRGSRHADELLGRASWIEEILTYQLDEISGIKDRFAFARKLRARKFDLWFDLTLDRASFTRMLRDMILARLLGARWAFGWRLEHIGFAARAEAEVTEFPDEVERLAEMLRNCGIESDLASFPPLVEEAPSKAMGGLLIKLRGDQKPIVAIAPGARRSCNLWPIERFETVAGELAASGARIVLIGSADDYSMCERIASRAGDGSPNLAGKLSLTDTCSMLRRVDLLICVDSGPQHLAAAMGTSCVALFSQRNARRRWYPHGNQHRVLEGSVECHTCLLDDCPYDNRCMKQITVEQVLAAARAKLEEYGCAWAEPANSRQSVGIR